MSTDLATVNGTTATLATLSPEILAKLVLEQDLSKFTAPQKVEYVTTLCNRLGIDPITRPFELLTYNGKLIPYPTKAATNQLTKVYRLSLILVSCKQIGDQYTVIAEARAPHGQVVQDMGVVNIAGMRGDALQNAMLKAVTKAKRRAVLSIVGLGMIDESEAPYNAITEPFPDAEVTDMGTVAGSVVDDWKVAIDSCTTLEELEGLAKEMGKLNDEAKAALRQCYADRLHQLRGIQ